MKHFKQLLFLSILCSLVLFTNCGDSDVVVVDTPTNNTDDDKTDDGTTDPVNYTLTLTASEGGTVSPESGSFGENEAVELLATPDSTYVFVNWTGSSTDTDNPFSVTMDSDKSYTANFVKKQYPLTIIIEGEGAVSEEIVTNGRVEDYDVGTLVQLTATPSQGWKFNGWKELEVETNPLEVTITEAITLTAKFYVPIDSVSLTPSALQMVLGGIDTLKASIYPTNASDTINWKSSDESIVTVNQDGIVTAIAKGEAVITVMTAKDSITNTAKVVISTDGDKDGIIDENDTCADTPEGATVDANGCADSQKDTDSDGVKDDKDTCADTPEGANVDANGCADSQKDTDSDGVKDDKDTCADTPDGATVDANGCADSQKDTDGDGVKDDKDTCADTPEGAVIDLEGCPLPAIYLDANGVTIKAREFAVVGESYELEGVSYSVVDLATLKTMINDREDVTKVVTTNITDMSSLFTEVYPWNEDISSWDVSNVTNMAFMFQYARTFNQSIGIWDVSSVINMKGMFQNAEKFNQNLNSWNVNKVTDMSKMFQGAGVFNNELNNWDVSSVTDMNRMFSSAGFFNQDLNLWNVGNVINMEYMFSTGFNGNITTWDVGKVTNMQGMFRYNDVFNQDISSWNVVNVQNMAAMFQISKVFNKDLSSWSVGNVTNCYLFSEGATAWTLPKPNFTNCLSGEESVWTGDVITFTKVDDADPTLATNQDRITDNVWITRDNAEGGQIYNLVLESASDKETSPLGTEWAEGDIANYASLTYTPFRTATVKPKDAVGKTFVVHLIQDNIYLSIKILSWSTNKAGGFSYERSTE
jgi:uncharacterized repeat protein (TIGR02543 family)